MYLIPLDTLNTPRRPSLTRYAQPIHQYQVIGRKLPTESDSTPQLYRMHIFARDVERARSRFWYFLQQYRKVKKTTGEILSVNEIFEKNDRVVSNYGVWLRYNSRSGTHNMYKEYRDVSLCKAIEQMFAEMAGTHRARKESIQIIRTAEVEAKDTRRVALKQFHDSGVKFPLVHVVPRASSKKFRKTFKAHRPTTFVG